MFSYRHSFHAGNHADVLKHMVLIASLRYLLDAKATPLGIIDTHAGAGLYRLDSEDARTSGEATTGVLPLWAHLLDAQGALRPDTPAALADYIALLMQFQRTPTQLRHYPGSPFIAAHLLREQDKLHLFELHPTDARLLAGNVAASAQASRIQLVRNNGFMGLKTLLPLPSRRGLVLMDPSYELKTDYAQTVACVQDALARFATGCYIVWYPIIARPEAHQLPRRLKTLANQAGRPWLEAVLDIGQPPSDSVGHDGVISTIRQSSGRHTPVKARPSAPAVRYTSARQATRPASRSSGGLRASGVFVINPPFVLQEQLHASLPVVLNCLRTGAGARWQLNSSATSATPRR